jgi:hypothetical protein
MKTLTSVKKLALGLALGGLFAWQAGATLAYNFPTVLSGAQPDNGPFSLGNVFTVSAPIEVTALGAFDPGGASFGAVGVDVAIYSITLSGTSLTGGSLVTPVVTFSGTQTLLPGTSTAMTGITPVTLAAGTYMVVANNYGAAGALQDYNPAWANGTYPGNPSHTGVNGASANDAFGVTFLPGAGYNQNSGTLTPSLSGSWSYDDFFAGSAPRYAAGNFDFTPVPEAAGFALAAVALLGLVYVGRAYSQKLKLA